MQPYPAEIEVQMQRYYQSLSEKDRRRYAAIEAVKLGYGGQAYIRRLLGCHHETLALGMAELEDETALKRERIRQVGGGRKSAFETIADAQTREIIGAYVGSRERESAQQLWQSLPPVYRLFGTSIWQCFDY
jgi:hypothetical protein